MMNLVFLNGRVRCLMGPAGPEGRSTEPFGLMNLNSSIYRPVKWGDRFSRRAARASRESALRARRSVYCCSTA